MKRILTPILLALLALLPACNTTTPEGKALTEASVTTLSYFAGAEVLSRATSVADHEDKKNVLSGLIVVLQGINRSTADGVEVRRLIGEFFRGKPAHWATLSHLVVTWINTGSTFEGRSTLLEAVVQGLNGAIGGSTPPI